MIRSLFRKWFGTDQGTKWDSVRTKLAIENATALPPGAFPALEASIDRDIASFIDTVRRDPPKELTLYTVQLVDADGARRVVCAEVDYFGLGRRTVEKFMKHATRALQKGERLDPMEIRIFDEGSPATVQIAEMKKK